MNKLVILFFLSKKLLFHTKETKKYYEWLEIHFSATDDQIQSAYESKLSKMKASGESGYKINQLKRAYEVLSDWTMKSIYDVDGEEEVRNYEMAKAHDYAQ